MKIGVLTFHRSYNYGAFLQCYSLVTQLKSKFPAFDVEVVDYAIDDNLGYKKAIENSSGKIKEFYVNRNNSMLEGLEYLPLSSKRFVGNSVTEVYDYISNNYDVLIVGSDAVFNWTGKGLPNVFMPTVKPKNTKLVSYAASSYGLNYRAAEKSELDIVRKSVSLFDYLGVRDVETENMLRFCGASSNIFHTCDPTCFLDLGQLPVDEQRLIDKLEKHNLDLSKPIIGIMAGEPIGRTIKKQFGDKVQLVSVYYPNRYADVYLDNLNQFEWARVFSYFNVFITHYFHGTMFSLKNGTPTIITERNTAYRRNYTTKIGDLLNRLELNEIAYPLETGNGSLLSRVLLKAGLADAPFQKGLIERIEPCIETKKRIEAYVQKVNKEAREFDKFGEYLNSL